MKLIFPVLTLSKGGAQRVLTELANRLTDIGYEVIILMPNGGIVEDTVKCEVIYSKETVLSEDDFPFGDVIVSNFYTTVAVSQRASEQGKGLHIRLSLCYEPAVLPGNSESFASYHRVRNVLVLSRSQQRIIRTNHGIQASLIPIGVNSSFSNLNVRDPEGNKLIVSAILRKPEGGFSEHKEQDYLLQQLNKVKELYPEVELLLIIPPGEFDESTALQKFWYDERYHIRTPANDIELCYHYSESDIFVSSSSYDAGGLPGLEAMRCGAALVTVYSGGNTEYCRHEHNCLMSYRFENRLAEDIITLIEDQSLRLQIARRGELDSSRFSWERSVQLFIDEITAIVSRHKS